MAGSGETQQSCRPCSKKGGSIFTCPWKAPHLEARWSSGEELFSRTVQDSNLRFIYHVIPIPAFQDSVQVSCFLKIAPDHHPYPDRIISPLCLKVPHTPLIVAPTTLHCTYLFLCLFFSLACQPLEGYINSTYHSAQHRQGLNKCLLNEWDWQPNTRGPKGGGRTDYPSDILLLQGTQKCWAEPMAQHPPLLSGKSLSSVPDDYTCP